VENMVVVFVEKCFFPMKPSCIELLLSTVDSFVLPLFVLWGGDTCVSTECHDHSGNTCGCAPMDSTAE